MVERQQHVTEKMHYYRVPMCDDKAPSEQVEVLILEVLYFVMKTQIRISLFIEEKRTFK